MSSKLNVDEWGNKFWKNENRQFHREDGPAVELLGAYNAWFINDLRHRIEGPAYEHVSGTKSWWVGDKCITELIRELLRKSPFGEDVHLGILADWWAEKGDFRLLEIVSPYFTEPT